MSRTITNMTANRDEFIFLPGHPDADSQGFINVNNSSLLSEMADYIMQARKAFHETELKSKRRPRISKFEGIL